MERKESLRDLKEYADGIAFDRHQYLLALQEIRRWLGPTAPTCGGCAVEIGEALRIIQEAIGD